MEIRKHEYFCNVPEVDGAKDYTDIDLETLTCTEREFAKLVGISPAMAHRLKVMGVIEIDEEDYGRILVQSSLRYYRQYLRPYKRAALDEKLKTSGNYKILGVFSPF